MINCQVCEHNPTGEKCELFGRVIGMHGCSSGIERKPKNNYEKIRAMTMEEMAEMLHGSCPDNPDCNKYIIAGSGGCHDCYRCRLDWLKEEME